MSLRLKIGTAITVTLTACGAGSGVVEGDPAHNATVAANTAPDDIGSATEPTTDHVTLEECPISFEDVQKGMHDDSLMPEKRDQLFVCDFQSMGSSTQTSLIADIEWLTHEDYNLIDQSLSEHYGSASGYPDGVKAWWSVPANNAYVVNLSNGLAVNCSASKYGDAKIAEHWCHWAYKKVTRSVTQTNPRGW